MQQPPNYPDNTGWQQPPYYNQPTEAYQQPQQPNRYYPPHQPGQFQPPTYNNPPPPPPQNRPPTYSGWFLATLIFLYLVAIGMMFLELIVTSDAHSNVDTSSSSGSGILITVATFMLLGLHGLIIARDGRNFFTLFGTIQWKQQNGCLGVVLMFLYFIVFIMPAIYLVRALQTFLKARGQTMGQALHTGWLGYRRKSKNTQLVIGIVCAILLFSFVTFTTFAAMADRTSALVQLTPTATPQQTALVTDTTPTDAPVSTATLDSSLPTDTPVPSPTATPKPKPTPTPKPIVLATPTSAPVHPTPTPKRCTGVNNNPWCYDFNPGNYITVPPSGFCNYFNCIPTFYGSDDPGDGYVIECQDGTYSQSGGESGACSYHGGEMRPLYSH